MNNDKCITCGGIFTISTLFVNNRNGECGRCSGIKRDVKYIPKAVRDECWKRYCGELLFGKCYVCERIISKDDFYAGYIISERNGGETNINNLKPTCKICNLSCGTMNLNDFKNKYFSKKDDYYYYPSIREVEMSEK